MSNRTTFPVEGNFHRPTIYAVCWAPNGASTVSAATVRGNSRVSVARSGVGTFTLTFADKMPELVYASARILSDTLAATTQKSLNISSYNQSAKTITITVVNTTTPGSPAADNDTLTSANNTQICCMFIFKNSVSKH